MAENEITVDQANAIETQEWIQSLDEVLDRSGSSRVSELFRDLSSFAQQKGARLPFTANTPYINTIPASEQPAYPGDLELEYRISSIIRWNAMAMVVKANRSEEGIGGHIASYASSATRSMRLVSIISSVGRQMTIRVIYLFSGACVARCLFARFSGGALAG
jgi:pyruvate dehydrogenase complex dehydrogenase (E1) component